MKKLFAIILALTAVCAFISGCSKKTDVKSLKNGIYYCEVTVNGEKDSELIRSPVTVRLNNGSATASIVWKTQSVEYMIVKGERYEPINASKESVNNDSKKNDLSFVIPMDFDMDFPVSALNTDVDAENPTGYVLCFSSSSLRASDNTEKK